MISRVLAIAMNTYREAIRQKVLYALVLFTAALIAFSLFLGQLTLGADTKIIKDMGLASIMVLGAMMSIFLGVGLIFKEVERRTIYTILSKPVTRLEFILGKFFGLASTILLEVVAMTILLFLVLFLYQEPLDFHLLKAVLLIYAELCVLIAAALLFSSYSSSFMSTLFCISFLIVGHIADDFALFIGPKAAGMLSENDPAMVWAGHFISAIIYILQLVSLDHFVINAKIVHGVSVPVQWIANSLFFAFCWISLLLFGALLLFRRKDLQ